MLDFDFNGILFALSYALDCVEHDVIGVTTNHGKRVAAIAMKVGEQMGVMTGIEDKQVLSACSVMHDCALSEYIQDEFDGVYSAAIGEIGKSLGLHCSMGEESMKLMPFDKALTGGAVLYHHENADGSGPFGKKMNEIPQSARLIQLSDTIDAGFDLSWMDDGKKSQIIKFVKDNTGIRFATEEAQAFLEVFNKTGFSSLRNEKIDLYLQDMLPGGRLCCSPQQLMDFASVFARIVDYKSHFTKTHSIGIAQKAHDMALYYGMGEEFAAKMYFAGALHDIGKLVVDRDILEKPDRLNDAEFKHIQTHAYYTYKILSDIPGLEDITRWASYHHEKLDGAGYPFGLTDKQLDKWERLMACLDIYQALTEERPYKKGMSHTEAVNMLMNMADGGKIDGRLVRDIDQYYGG